MPGNTWKDLIDKQRSNTAGFTAERFSAQAQGLNSSETKNAIERATQASPRLADLLAQRKALENQLRSFSGGSSDQQNSRDAARFHVLSLAERRAQQREWEEKHEQRRARSAKLRQRARNSRSPSLRSADADKLRSTQSSVTQWLASRDSQRQSLMQLARDRLSPLNDVAQTGRQLRDLDQPLAEQGLSQEREQIRSLLGERNIKLLSKVDRYAKKAESTAAKIDKIDRSWEKRQQQISGAMDQIGSYFERANRRLSTQTGGSGDLFERMERNRQQALNRRLQKRHDEEKDEARRKRAIRNKRKGNKKQ